MMCVFFKSHMLIDVSGIGFILDKAYSVQCISEMVRPGYHFELNLQVNRSHDFLLRRLPVDVAVFSDRTVLEHQETVSNVER